MLLVLRSPLYCVPCNLIWSAALNVRPGGSAVGAEHCTEMIKAGLGT